jgi:hypothetical protein
METRLAARSTHSLAAHQTASSVPALAPDGSIWIGGGDGRLMGFEAVGPLRWEHRPGPGDPPADRPMAGPRHYPWPDRPAAT